MVKTTASMSSDAFFDFDSARLRNDARQALDEVIATLRRNDYTGNLRLTGHTCDIGPAAYNQRLSERRALAVKDYLVKVGGLPADRIVTEGMGESQPKFPNTRATRHKNRRVDLEFVTYTERIEEIVLPGEPGRAAPPPIAAAPPAPMPAITPRAPEAPTPPAAPVPPAAPTAAVVPAAPVVPVAPVAPPPVATAVAPPIGEWKKEYIDTEPAWLRRALHNTVRHKQTVDTYRDAEREVTLATGDKRFLNRAPVAANDAYTVDQNSSANSLDVLANDSDADGDALRLVSVGTPAHGSAQVSGGRVSYTPATGYSGPDSFAYTVADARGATATAQVAVTVRANNRAPNARDDFAVSLPATPLLVSVLANDDDPDGDALTITAVTRPELGSCEIVGSQIRFTPPGNVLNRTTTCRYTVSDGRGGSATATLSVFIDP